MLKRSMFWAVIVALAATTPAAADLIAHWEFDNATNVGEATLSDDLTVVGDASYSAAGKIGGALALDGSGDYLHLDGDALPTDIPTGNSSYSVAAWIQTSAQKSNGIVGWGIASTGRFNGSRTGTTNVVQNYSWSLTYDIIRTGVDYADGQWHHFAATYDAATGEKKLYWDGNQLGAALTLPAVLNVGAENFRLGTIHQTYGDEDFNGLLDDVRIYSHALSGDEVADLVPEPSTWTLLGIGLLGLFGWRRRFRS